MPLCWTIPCLLGTATFWFVNYYTNDICDTVNCVKTAAMLAEKMDQSMDPCEDFDKYACGNFYQTVALEDGETRKNSFSLVSDRNNDFLKSILAEETKPGDRDYMINAKNLYKSCMDEGKIEEIGVQPFLNTSYAKEWPTLIDTCLSLLTPSSRSPSRQT
ncbi:hypothetical protein RRG08_017917 [Elysia crispata]|uniref:Peptidase M13 N-terminal domain-containing protein n=1 Tax=Elysia crispata TaxID=231223 RepID=A0AAE1AAK1_9GAST|nr:hypothetical protein RRG08_017917 [Elysia crispata]